MEKIKFDQDNKKHVNNYVISYINIFNFINMYWKPPLQLKQSDIPLAGNGCFAKKKIKRGEIIGFEKHINNTNDGIFIKTSENNYFDDIFNILDKYENIEIIENKINTKICCFLGLNFLQAIRDINKDEEITRYYGLDYWIITNIINAHKETDITYRLYNMVKNNNSEFTFITKEDRLKYSKEIYQLGLILKSRKYKYSQEKYDELQNIINLYKKPE